MANLETENLSIEYNGVQVVNSVSMKFERQAITAILGPSGCGKSSLLTSLNRLNEVVPGMSIKGSIFCDGIDIQHIRPVGLIRRKIGLILQKPNPFPISIYKNLEVPLRDQGMRDKKKREKKIMAALHDVGLLDEVKDRINDSALYLSGGQMQRLCIARSLVLQPQILLLDEPCSSLDPYSTQVIETLLKKLKKRITIIIVTHNIGQAKRLADHVALFWHQADSGSLLEFGEKDRLFNEPQKELTRRYLQGALG